MEYFIVYYGKVKMIQSIVGFFVFAIIAWIISENRNKISFKTVLLGMIIQLLIGILFIKVAVFKEFFIMLNNIVLFLEESTSAGTSVVFGYLGGAQLPFDEKFPGASFVLAFKALPLVMVMSAISALLFYWRVLPFVVRCFSWALQKIMFIGGCEGLGISANIFVGMVEAPLLIRPYLKDMTRSEIFSLMTSGMATIAGTVMVLYASILSNIIPDIMGHIIAASIISLPAAVTISKIMVPETKEPTYGKIDMDKSTQSSMDAVANGTLQGVQLFINIIAMLIVLVALVHLSNIILGLFIKFNGDPLTIQKILGILMMPVVWLMGISWQEAYVAGSLMGVKTVLNEFLAYLDMSRLNGVLSPKSMLIMTYAMCGFANPGSLGIMIGGMATIAPERKSEIVSLGLRSIIAGTLSTCMTGAVVGFLL
jgi:CNT family concentrative nucleoside transporter